MGCDGRFLSLVPQGWEGGWVFSRAGVSFKTMREHGRRVRWAVTGEQGLVQVCGFRNCGMQKRWIGWLIDTSGTTACWPQMVQARSGRRKTT